MVGVQNFFNEASHMVKAPEAGTVAKIVRGWVCLPNLKKSYFLETYFLLNSPPISIPFWIERQPILPIQMLFTIICPKYTQI